MGMWRESCTLVGARGHWAHLKVSVSDSYFDLQNVLVLMFTGRVGAPLEGKINKGGLFGFSILWKEWDFRINIADSHSSPYWPSAL